MITILPQSLKTLFITEEHPGGGGSPPDPPLNLIKGRQGGVGYAPLRFYGYDYYYPHIYRYRGYGYDYYYPHIYRYRGYGYEYYAFPQEIGGGGGGIVFITG
jgi:hypothetical protein